MNPRMMAALDYREQTEQKLEEYMICSARLRHAVEPAKPRIKRSLWAWLTMAVLFPGSWVGTYAVAEFVLHLLRIPHWH